MTETLKLTARMDLSAAQQLVQNLSERDLSNGLVLDATDVDHLGALCAQALIAAARAATAQGSALTIENVSDRVEQQLAAMGLSSQTIMEGAR